MSEQDGGCLSLPLGPSAWLSLGSSKFASLLCGFVLCPVGRPRLLQSCQRGDAAQQPPRPSSQPGASSSFHTNSHRDLGCCSRFSAASADPGSVPSFVLGHQGSLRQPRWFLKRCSPSFSCAHVVQIMLGALGAGPGADPLTPRSPGPSLPDSFSWKEAQKWASGPVPLSQPRKPGLGEGREQGLHASPSSSSSGEWPLGQGGMICLRKLLPAPGGHLFSLGVS